MRISLKNGPMLEGHKANVKSINLSADGTLCVTAGLDGTAKVWDVGMARCVKTISGFPSQITAIHCRSDFAYIWFGLREGHLIKYDIMSDHMETITKGNYPITSIAVDYLKERVYYATTHQNLNWVNKDKSVGVVKGRAPCTDYSILNTKRYILTRDTEKDISLWNLTTGQEVFKWPSGDIKTI